ncbi:flagellar basal body-associated FliL family protein [Clostridium hydrogeniformans]|uniref:flagellar basal body-associated FliL family protein n=1 Tax=Clostridium hydrogeniformans TaxID=349933 RepID=UPI00068FCA1E|nr:flagellar basal body-associated FliL family protein [Clostridium hydrogeniformans]
MSEVKTENKKSKVGVTIIVVLLLIIIGGGGFMWYKMQALNAGASQNSKIEEGKFGLNEIIVNLADEGGKKYIKIKPVLGYNSSNKELEGEFATKDHVLRDITIAILRGKTSKDLNPKGEEELKKEMLQKLNPVLDKGKLTNVYFTDFLIQ